MANGAVLASALKAADAANITVVGSINVDLIAKADRLPGPGETVGGATLYRQHGGKGANQAVAAARLAGGARMIGAVGDDADGLSALAHLANAGVDVTGVRKVAEPTGTALIVVDSTGENQIAVCAGANASVSLDGVSFGESEVVLCQLEVDVPVVLEAARRARGFFALNTAPAMPVPRELIDRCDLIISNETEYQLIPELANAKLVAVTYGANGSAIYRRGERIARAPGQQATVVSTVGAGDAFCAALVLAIAMGHGYQRALQVANAVGAEAVSDASSQPALSRLENYQPEH